MSRFVLDDEPQAPSGRFVLDDAPQNGLSRKDEVAKGAKMTNSEASDYLRQRAAFAQEGGVTTFGTAPKKTDTRKVSYSDQASKVRARTKEGAKAVLKDAEPYYRPLLEGGGAAIGGIVGAGGGTVAAPGPGTLAGGVAGGALGYAMGKNVADTLAGDWAETPQDATVRSLKDIATGATYEMGGQVGGLLAGKALSGGINTYRKAANAVGRSTPAVTKSAMERKAGQIITDNMGDSPLYEKNAAAAAQLEIPGYRPSLGEARNDPGLIKLQRGIERQPGTAGSTIMENKTANQAALKDYIGGAFPGSESADDVVIALARKKAQLETATKQAEQQASMAQSALNPADPQTVGRGVVDAIEEERLPAKQKVGELYNALPNEALPTKNTAAAVKELKKGFRPGDEDVFPSRAISRIEEAIQGPKPSTGGHGKAADPVILDATGKPLRDSIDPTKAEVGFQDLHSLRKDLGRQIQAASTGAQPNLELAMKLRSLKEAVDADIDAGMGGSNVAEQYKDARKAFQDYALKYRTGEVAKITQRGNQASGRNIPDALIPKRIFTMDGADDFLRAAPEAAPAHADQYAAQELLLRTNPVTGELSTKAVASWLQKNMTVLRKYGISGKYNTIAKAQAAVDAARAVESQFTKSAASKILNSDVDKAVGAAFSSNPSNTGAVADELLTQIGTDPQAKKGLQNAFKDFLVGKVETTAKTIAGDSVISPAAIQKEIVKYAPAMRKIYTTQQVSALNKVSKAVEIQGRSARSPIGGGSDTMENLSSAMATLGRIVDVVPGTGMVKTLGKWGLGKLNSLSEQEVNQVIARALYDPELAQTLMLAAKRYKPALVEKRVNSHLITMGLVATRNTEDK